MLMVDLNILPQELRGAREEELATVVVDCGLEDMIYHFLPRWRYRGDGRWTWWVHSEVQKVTGQGD